MSAKNYDMVMKLLIVGEQAVGKSSMLTRYADNKFTSSYIMTIGIDFKIMSFTSKSGKKIKLHIWDTAGQERFRSITTAYYRGANGVILMYDITNRSTFENVVGWMRTLNNYASNRIKVILVGNKIDMESNRQVSYEEGKALADKLKIPFAEVSVREDINIKETFSLIIETLVDQPPHVNITDKIPVPVIVPSRKCCNT